MASFFKKNCDRALGFLRLMGLFGFPVDIALLQRGLAPAGPDCAGRRTRLPLGPVGGSHCLRVPSDGAYDRGIASREAERAGTAVGAGMMEAAAALAAEATAAAADAHWERKAPFYRTLKLTRL